MDRKERNKRMDEIIHLTRMKKYTSEDLKKPNFVYSEDSIKLLILNLIIDCKK